MPYSREQVFAARDDSKDLWSVGNQVLYDMCRDYPRHAKPGEVVAKLWLIGKSYSAALDRGRGSAGGDPVTSDEVYCKRAAPALVESDIDARLAGLPIETELTKALLRPVLQTHGALVHVFEAVAGRAHRSLASKYLHFHRPELFFIYDSRAREALDAAEPASGKGREASGADRQYAGFVRRATRYRERLAERFGVRLTPRELDRLFLRFPLPE
jgi:hypothetical protein